MRKPIGKRRVLTAPDVVVQQYRAACHRASLNAEEVIEAALVAAVCMGPENFLRECQMSVYDACQEMGLPVEELRE